METVETGMRTEIDDDPASTDREGSISQIYQVKKTMNFVCNVVPGSASDLSDAPPMHCKFKGSENSDKDFDFHVISKPYSESNMSIEPQDGSKRVPDDDVFDLEGGESSLQTGRDCETGRDRGDPKV
jgi:hypothetical protein